jgi:putative endonuclease
MCYVYILESLKNGRYYIGVTGKLEDRLKRHNAGETKSTKQHAPYKIIFTESFASLSEARMREIEIKRRKSRKYIEEIVKSGH